MLAIIVENPKGFKIAYLNLILSTWVHALYLIVEF